MGIDLGLKTTATLSDGTKINHNPYSDYEAKLAMAQRANKKRLVRTIHAKIRNLRNDYIHKVTTAIVVEYDAIYVGNVSSTKLAKTTMAKSVNDNAWGKMRTTLAYKAIGLGAVYEEVDEKFSSITCSNCLVKTNQFSGLSGLGVREWVCDSCGTRHDRDVNAALNILRMGHHAPKGIPIL